MPAAIEAWRAGFWPWPAVRICPMMTSETLPPSTPARLSASLIATLPSSCAGRLDKRPVECPNRRAGRADDDDIVLHLMSPMLL